MSPTVRPGVAGQDESHKGPDLRPWLDDLVPVLSEHNPGGETASCCAGWRQGPGANDCSTCSGLSLG